VPLLDTASPKPASVVLLRIEAKCGLLPCQIEKALSTSPWPRAMFSRIDPPRNP
jgi:hypothetical protein